MKVVKVFNETVATNLSNLIKDVINRVLDGGNIHDSDSQGTPMTPCFETQIVIEDGEGSELTETLLQYQVAEDKMRQMQELLREQRMSIVEEYMVLFSGYYTRLHSEYEDPSKLVREELRKVGVEISPLDSLYAGIKKILAGEVSPEAMDATIKFLESHA